METNPTPFDLNRAIQQWRENLGDSPALRRENLDELEMHLRDSIANLKHRGLTEDEAFLVAARRLGGESALGREFGKVNAPTLWLHRVLWMLIGIQLLASVHSFVAIVTCGAEALSVWPADGAANLTASPILASVCFGMVHLLAFAAALAAVWWLLRRQSSRMSAWCRAAAHDRRRLAGFAVGCLVLLLVPRVVSGFTQAFTMRYLAPAAAGKFYMSISYGPMLASLIEGAALIVLTALLARRQWFAKT